ncbi:DUF1963 domain-containing protein [Eleftheria terrae]|nr:DUF1963 domain-containing protein [Eleftheria terrae]
MSQQPCSAPQDVFRIGKADFAFAQDCRIEFVDGGMRFDLKGVPMPFDAGLHAEAFDPDEGAAAPHLYSATLHFDDRSGEPHHVFRYPDRSHGIEFSLFWNGLRYGLRFFGDVDLAPHRIALKGRLRREHDDEAAGVPLELVRHGPGGSVQLRPRYYDSIEAALAVAPERVRRLSWYQPWTRETPRLDEFPAEVLRWRQLETLSLTFASQGHARFTTLPEALASLQSLTDLHIGNSSVRQLPEVIGRLRGLRRLSFTGGALCSLPDSLAQLDRLEVLDLSHNQLTLLPEYIGHLPALKQLDLRGNPFASLPASLARIESVRVDPRHRALYLDTRYRPDIELPANAELFLARSHPGLLAWLQPALARQGLAQHAPALLRHARQALRWRTTTPDQPAVPGGTRFGGAPDLPPAIHYPMTEDRYWHFYAQLDLEAVAGLQSWLPRTGRLYFFAEGLDAEDRTLVLHDTSPRARLRPHVWSDGACFVDGSEVPTEQAGYRATADVMVSLPVLYRASHRLTGEDAGLLEIRDEGPQEAAYHALGIELAGSEELLQDVHVQNAHVSTQGDSPEEQAMAVHGGQLDEWVNLLSLYSDPRPGFSFWDAGRLTFTIHRKDLALGDFSHVQVSLESY